MFKKEGYIILTLLIFGLKLFSQSNSELPYNFTQPQFVGGNDGLKKYFIDQLKGSKNGLSNSVETKCILTFVLRHDTTISKIEIKDSTSSSTFNKKFYLAIQNSAPFWKPSTLNGNNVDVTIFIAVGLITSLKEIGPTFLIKTEFLSDKILEDNYYNEAVAIQNSGDLKEAIIYYSEAIQINRADSDALFNRGICYLKLNDSIRACNDWHSLKQLGSDIADKAISRYCLEFNKNSKEVIDSAMQVFSRVQQMPEFHGGEKSLSKFLNENIVYPSRERDKKIQGKVYVSFIVTKEGEIKSAKVISSVPAIPAFQEEALRVIKIMPKWKPGKQNDNPVNVFMKIPVSFQY
ncbi:MAG: TonB family protein [Bacteroidia bacterium]